MVDITKDVPLADGKDCGVAGSGTAVDQSAMTLITPLAFNCNAQVRRKGGMIVPEYRIDLFVPDSERFGFQRRQIFLLSQVAYPLREGDAPGTTRLSFSNGEKTVVRMDIRELDTLFFNRDIKASCMGDNCVIDLTRLTVEKPAPAHVKGDLYVDIQNACDKKGQPLTLTFNEAATYAKQMNEKKYLGFDDWRIPTNEELKLLIENKNKSGLKETFDNACHKYGMYYWASESDQGSAMGRRLTDNDWDWRSTNNSYFVRLVRGSIS